MNPCDGVNPCDGALPCDGVKAEGPKKLSKFSWDCDNVRATGLGDPTGCVEVRLKKGFVLWLAVERADSEAVPSLH